MLSSLAHILVANSMAAGVACCAVLALPGTICGLSGIVEAYCGRRRRALLSGIIASIQVVPLSFFACVGVLAGREEPRGLGPFLLVCWGLLPSAIALWAVLLALMIPAKPDSPDSP